MSVDTTKINYYQGWDIDQLVQSGELAIGSGDTAVITVPATIPLPVFELQFRPTGSSVWYQPGTNTTTNTLASNFTWYSYISGGVIHAVTTTSGTLRYSIWADKINY